MQSSNYHRGLDYSAMLKASGVARVRCPQCFKLFAIHASEINDARPKFQCSGCEQKFWIAFPEVFENTEATIGFPLEWIEKNDAKNNENTSLLAVEQTASLTRSENIHETAQVQPVIQKIVDQKQYNCPKCSEPFSAAAKECNKCGIVFEKYYQLHSQQAKTGSRTDASKELKEAWEDVIQSYEEFSAHQRFLNQCFSEDNLEFATFKYADLLSACPTDELALKAQKQIEAFTQIRFENLKLATEVQPKPLWKRIDWSKFKASYVLLFVSLALIVVGLTSPYLRNLVGFGSSILFILLALRFYFRAI